MPLPHQNPPTDRRTQHRLREIIDQLRAGQQGNRLAIEALAERLAEVRQEVEALKRATTGSA